MAGLEHRFRLGLFNSEITYRMTPDRLEWQGPRGGGHIAYNQIQRIHVFQVRKFGVGGQSSARVWRCVLHARDSGRICLAQDHFVRLGLREDRQRSFRVFTRFLIARISAANSQVSILQDEANRTADANPLAAWVAMCCFNLLRRLKPEYTSAIAGAAMQTIGPWLPEHRVGRENLDAAFPGKTRAEIEKILTGVWNNYGRACVGIAHLDRVNGMAGFAGTNGKIVVDEETLALLEKYRRDRKPGLFFTAHLSNWEIPAPLGKAMGVDIVAPVRVQHLGPMATILAKGRPGGPETYIPIAWDTVFKLKAAVDRGACIAVMVDQHDADGIEVVFFGRTCKVTPLLGRLARALEWPILGIRAVRLPDQRIRVDVVGPIKPSRGSDGRIDVAGTMQGITSVVEGWVREHPDQWLWLHRRWR